MPNSKRDKKISLTKTKKKGLALKRSLVEEIRKSCDLYKHAFVFDVSNMRNNTLKDWRTEWKEDSRFFLGKTSVMAVALGRKPEDEYRDGVHHIANLLVGNVGLLFTNRTKAQVVEFCRSFSVPDYARSGFVSKQTVRVAEGPLPQFSHAIEPHMRQLGLHTSLRRGIVHLDKETTICEKGKPLTPENARILKLFGHRMADFRISVKAVWSVKTGKFQEIKPESQIEPDDDVCLGAEDLAGVQEEMTL